MVVVVGVRAPGAARSCGWGRVVIGGAGVGGLGWGMAVVQILMRPAPPPPAPPPHHTPTHRPLLSHT
jgi:hypothetical protein